MALSIPEDKVAEIKQAADIVQVISDTVLLKQTGKDFVGLCPFHSEKTPSFNVIPGKQMFYCFGCGVGGNVFNFLMKRDGISFVESVRMLASRFGVDLPEAEMSLGQRRQIALRQEVLATNRRAMVFFSHMLHRSASGEPARKYLSKRKMSAATIDEFQLGYAPAGWNHLVAHFAKNKVAPEVLVNAGLASRNDSGRIYDRFRDRIMFPILNPAGQVIAFGGRVMDDSNPKYLNSPETPVFNKSRSLYGLHRAKDSCRSTKRVYIVEGYFDALAMHQHGISNAVATLGTALTPEHVQMLHSLMGQEAAMILVYDSDEAGIRAAQRSIEIFRQGSVDARFLVLPDGYDPDSFLMEHGPEAFQQKSANAGQAFSFLLDLAIKRHGDTADGRIRIISALKPSLLAIQDRLARSLCVKEMAERVGIDEQSVLDMVRKGVAGQARHLEPEIRDAASVKGRSRIEQRIVAMMLQFREVLPEIRGNQVLDRFESSTLKAIGQLVLDKTAKGPCPVSDILSGMPDSDSKALAIKLAMAPLPWDQAGCLKLIGQLETGRINKELRNLKKQIKAAEVKNDLQQVEVLQRRQMELIKEQSRYARKRPGYGMKNVSKTSNLES